MYVCYTLIKYQLKRCRSGLSHLLDCVPFSQPVQNSRRYLLFLPRDARISAAYAVLRCLSVTFVYRVETVKDAAIVAMECE